MAEASTIDPREAAHFGRMAAEWWDPKGSSAMLHRLNPVRLAYIRDRIDQHLLVGIRALELLRAGGIERLHSRKLRSFDEPPFR